VKRAAFAATLAAGGPAFAHSTVPGGALGAALADPALLIALAATALWIGQQGRMMFALGLFAGAVALGIALNHTVGAARTQDALLAATVLVGLGTVVAYRWPAWCVALAGAVVGVNFGRGVELGAGVGLTRAGTAGGAWLVALAGVALGAWCVSRLHAPWLRIGVRVAASWLTAAALLVLALAFAP
jgi:hypothetical protein